MNSRRGLNFFYLTSHWNSTLSVRCRAEKRGPGLEKLIREREGIFEAFRENETRNSKTKPLFTSVKRGVPGVPTGIRFIPTQHKLFELVLTAKWVDLLDLSSAAIKRKTRRLRVLSEGARG